MIERRIAAPRDTDKLLERLTTPDGASGVTLFESKQKVLMFAAALGYSLNSRDTSHNRDASTAIRLEIFEKQNDDAFIDALAVRSANNLKVLAEEQSGEAANLFEEYAAGGLRELERVLESARDPLGAILDQVLAQRGTSSADLAGVDPAVLQRMMKNLG